MEIKRRRFIRNVGLAGLAATASVPSKSLTVTPSIKPATGIGPTPQQKACMKLQFGMFIHFKINTYYYREWGDGPLDPKAFHPGKLNTDQWCRTARETGMNYIIHVTKHHDGFCLWPTKYTCYTVAATPWKGDMVAEIADNTFNFSVL